MKGFNRFIAVAFSGLLILSASALLVACGGDPGDSDTPAAPDATNEPAETSGAEAPTAEATGTFGTASVAGTITYDGEVPRLRPLSMDADPACASKHSEPVMPEALLLGADNTLGNVFVTVKSGLDGAYGPPGEPVVMDQLGCQYTPHVMGVMVGQPFKVLNSDGLLHNVHSLSKVNSPFNRAMPGSVKEAEFTFTKEEGVFKVKCDVHPWMGAFVAVSTHPFFAVSDASGSYSIPNLPAGSYEIEAWHEKLGVQTASVTVGEGEASTADFTFAR